MKTLILSLFFLIATPLILLSQPPNTIEFNYDKAGNRILRQAIFVPGIIQNSGQKPDSLNFNDISKAILADSLIVDTISIKIYPNPTYGRFEVLLGNYTEGNNIQYSIYTLAGQVVINEEISNNVTEVNLQNFESGPYLFQLIINGKSNSWRIIKR